MKRGSESDTRKPVHTIRASVRTFVKCMFRIAGNSVDYERFTGLFAALPNAA